MHIHPMITHRGMYKPMVFDIHTTTLVQWCRMIASLALKIICSFSPLSVCMGPHLRYPVDVDLLCHSVVATTYSETKVFLTLFNPSFLGLRKPEPLPKTQGNYQEDVKMAMYHLSSLRNDKK